MPDYKQRYENAKLRLFSDKHICQKNRDLFRSFFLYEEYKLKRKNNLSQLDDGSYKTLLSYCTRFQVVNRWFKNKPWVDLQEKDIKKVYDDLEDGVIKTRFGKPVSDRDTYYRLIIRSKPFELAGKREIAQKVMEFYNKAPPGEVRFIREETFRKMVEVVPNEKHRGFLWLAWDTGENGSSILQLDVRDLVRSKNPDTGEVEYLVNFRKDILKRSRTPRTEPTNYHETVELLDRILAGKNPGEKVFDFGPRMAKKIIDRAARLTNSACLPEGKSVTLKDLRSSMACDLLQKGWSRDEVNSRLGHKPSSREIDRYINYLALDRPKAKQKVHNFQVAQLKAEINELRESLKHAHVRQDDHVAIVKMVVERIDKLERSLQRNRS